ncbi:carbohydrate kinase family protein [Nocardiopsis lambiniae]|uniref:Carbohydrate kinase n=1 Tax=Nocardiopsis lambiniae TaxID=3075539 RepID=A0ABU2MBQ4_9ACTN|nr:carbohydrate kinase [Nocardiopsis sp. DSM 44743]MDT0330098.1 carbohydrate kinase [Nocardiopsis sp. DSM 44743]
MIVVCGEALVDLVPRRGMGTGELWRAVPGGGPANTAVALAGLGADTALLCRLSGDAFGRAIRAHLTDHGVDLRLAVTAREPSTLAVVSLDPWGSAEYGFYLRDTADWLWGPGEVPEPPEDTEAIHVGSLAAVIEPGAGHLLDRVRAHRGRAVVCFDVNARPAVGLTREEVARHAAAWADTAHIVKASDEDLAWLEPDADPLDTARAWTDRHGLDLMLLTRGAEGAVALSAHRTEEIAVPGVRVEVRDTVGAGDAFGAAVLARLGELGRLGDPAGLADLDPERVRDVLGFAVAAAALACTTEGALAPTRERVRGFMDLLRPVGG